MARVLDQGELSAGDRLQHALGDLGREDVAERAADDEGRDVDVGAGAPGRFGIAGADRVRRAERAVVAVGPAPVGGPHQAVVHPVAMVGLRRPRIGGAGGGERLVAAGEDVAGPHAGLDSAGAGGDDFRPDVDDDERAQLLRPAAGVVHRHHAAHGKAEQGEVLQAERADEGDQVLGHVVGGVFVRRRPCGLAVAALVERQHAVAVGHRRGERVPRPRMAGEAVQQHEVLGAGPLGGPVAVVEAQTAHLDQFVDDGFRQGLASSPAALRG